MKKTCSLIIAASLLVFAACDKKEDVKVINTEEGEHQGAPTISAPGDDNEAEAAPDDGEDGDDGGLGLMNEARPADGLITAAQPTLEQFQKLKDAGVTKVISLRTEGEPVDFDVEPTALRQKLVFKRIPIAGPDDLTRENVEALAAALDDADGDVLLYCGSSNRVGAMLALKAKWVDGKSVDEALAIGRAAGLTSLEEPVKAKLGE